nr:hypothetical protein GCM10020092_059850 [Actinoplanes digitatis]
MLPSGAALADVAAVFDTNVLGVIRVTNAMLPLLLRSPYGRIVNVSSGVGSLTRMSDPADYLAGMLSHGLLPARAKSALNSLTIQYAKELRGTAILVNAADPGLCDTDFTRPLGSAGRPDSRAGRRDRGAPGHPARGRADRHAVQRRRPGAVVAD